MGPGQGVRVLWAPSICVLFLSLGTSTGWVTITEMQKCWDSRARTSVAH